MNIVSCQVAFVKRKFDNIQTNVIVGVIHELPLHPLPSPVTHHHRQWLM
jgi:hypothetical protein